MSPDLFPLLANKITGRVVIGSSKQARLRDPVLVHEVQPLVYCLNGFDIWFVADKTSQHADQPRIKKKFKTNGSG